MIQAEPMSRFTLIGSGTSDILKLIITKELSGIE